MNFKEYVNRGNFKLYCDVDGVLADFHGYAKRVVPGFYIGKPDVVFPKGIFSKLPILPGAHELVDYLRNTFGPKFFILTATPKDSVDETEAIDKRNWLKKHFNIDPKQVFVVSRSDKQKYAVNNPNNILIDDYDRNTKEWTKAGGTSILYTSTSQAIKEVESIIAG